MSYAVERGKPNKSQLYFDKLLERIENSEHGVRERDRHTLGEILFFCMKDQPDVIRFVDGATDEHVSNRQLVRECVRVARVLEAGAGGAGGAGGAVVCVSRPHRRLLSWYAGAVLAGRAPLLLDASSTVYEIKYFLEKVEPTLIFCDLDKCEDVKVSLSELKIDLPIVVAEGCCGPDYRSLDSLLEGVDDNVDTYCSARVDPDSAAILLPTSGSTGLPKATILTHRGLVAQLPSLWSHHEEFPRPTRRALLVSGPQWMTHATVTFAAAAYHVPVVGTSRPPTTDHIIHLIHKYQVSWVLLGPASGAALAAAAGALRSLRTVVLTGGPVAATTLQAFKSALPEGAAVRDGYGMTELHGFLLLPDPSSPPGSIGKPLNITNYKVVDECGQEVGAWQRGELLFKSKYCLMKGYYKEPQQTAESFTRDGWFRSGDEVFATDAGDICYVRRIKFCFKYDRYHISPEEIERVVRGVRGVALAAVGAGGGGSAGSGGEGPAALVMRHHVTQGHVTQGHVTQGHVTQGHVTEDDVHRAVNDQLSDHKRLRGGVFFVSAIPLTHSGKIHRAKCQELLNQLTEERKQFK